MFAFIIFYFSFLYQLKVIILINKYFEIKKITDNSRSKIILFLVENFVNYFSHNYSEKYTYECVM